MGRLVFAAAERRSCRYLNNIMLLMRCAAAASENNWVFFLFHPSVSVREHSPKTKPTRIRLFILNVDVIFVQTRDSYSFTFIRVGLLYEWSKSMFDKTYPL